EVADVRVDRVAVRPAHPQRSSGVEGGAVIQELAVKADVAAVEVFGDVQLDLATFVGVEAGVARAFALAIEAANVKTQAATERCTVGEVGTVSIVVEADGRLDGASSNVAGARLEIDHAARGVGGKGGG